MSDQEQKVIHPPAFVVDTDTLRAIVREAVSDALIRVGVDAAEASDLRKDMLYLRSMRETTERIRQAGLTAAVKWATLALIGAVLVGIGIKLGIKVSP